MSIGKTTSNINTILAEAMYNKLRAATNDETYYAAVAFSDSEDYIRQREKFAWKKYPLGGEKNEE